MTQERIAVIGAGYVGLTCAAAFASLGHQVTAIDTDEGKVASLNAGRVPILEAGLPQLVVEGLEVGLLAFSADYTDVDSATVALLCLPTPVRADGALDLRFVRAAAAELGGRLAPDSIVITKSTVPVGTADLVSGWLGRDDVHVVSNPEFLREGTAVADFLAPDRIVIGAESTRAGQRVADLYQGVDAPLLITDPASAELIKYASNAFLAAKLSFVNEMARLSDATGADIVDVTAGLGLDPRVGAMFLTPGPGWGGSCFPKDTAGLAHLARSRGLDLPVVDAAKESNQIHFHYLLGELEAMLGDLRGAKLAIWGAAFKAGTGDTRDSPAIEIITRLEDRGAQVIVHDPAACADLPGVTEVADAYSACVGADAVVVLTEWPEFADLDLDKVADALDGDQIYDARGVIDPVKAEQAGLRLRQLGRARTAA